MGNFYTNVSLKADRQRAIDWLRQARQPAWVGPQVGAWCVAANDTSYSGELVEPLSRALQSLAIGAIVVDDDVLGLTAVENGRSLAVYESLPGYGDPSIEAADLLPTINGMGELLVSLGSPVSEAELLAVLNRPDEFVFASELHEKVCVMLGLPMYAATFGYSYAELGEFPTATAADYARTP